MADDAPCPVLIPCGVDLVGAANTMRSGGDDPRLMGLPLINRTPWDDGADLDRADLSPWFNPFLSHFAADARRCGGEVRVIRDDEAVTGLMVSDPVERVGSVFSRSRAIAEPFVRDRGPFGLYSEFPFEPSGEVFDILTLSLTEGAPSHRFRHPLRPFSAKDLPEVLGLLREVYGVVNERWFDQLPSPTEAGFLSEVDGRIAGIGWVSLARRRARLHSLTVRAPFRRMGIGTDLLFARLLWAHRSGALDVLSEISQRNPGSLTVAARGGLRRVGQIYFYPPL